MSASQSLVQLKSCRVFRKEQGELLATVLAAWGSVQGAAGLVGVWCGSGLVSALELPSLSAHGC